jgi:hypothetical protein
MIAINIYAQPYYISNKQKHYLETIDGKELIYKTDDNHIVKVTNRIIVSFNKKIELNIKELIELSENIYLYETKDKKETLRIANELSKNRNIKYAHPDFIIKKKTKSAKDINRQFPRKSQTLGISLTKGK